MALMLGHEWQHIYIISIHMIACHHVVQLHTCPYTVVNLLACCPNIYNAYGHLITVCHA
jgi:hypothetical protein